jgi:hypothetical protein
MVAQKKRDKKARFFQIERDFNQPAKTKCFESRVPLPENVLTRIIVEVTISDLFFKILKLFVLDMG